MTDRDLGADQTRRPRLEVSRGAQPRDGAPDIVPYEFGRRDRFGGSQMRGLQVVCGRFLHTLSASLSAYLGCEIDARLGGIEQCPYQRLLEAQPAPVWAVALSLRPHAGSAVLDLAPAFVFPILEILLGAKTTDTAGVERPLTEIEQNIVEIIVDIILSDLRQAWKSLTTADFHVVQAHTDAAMLRVLDPAELVVVVQADVRVGESTGFLRIAVPGSVLRAFEREPGSAPVRPEQHPQVDERLLGLVGRAAVLLEARMPESTLPVRSLIRLRNGDVVCFACPVDRSLECLVNGKLKFRGRMLAAGPALSFRIDEVCDSQP